MTAAPRTFVPSPDPFDLPIEGEPGRQAWLLLFQLIRSQKREMATLQAEFQLNGAQLQLLMHLDLHGARPMSEIAEHLCVDASYVTGLVDRVEAKGLVQRTASPEDRRVKLVALTPEGMATRERLIDRVSQPPPFIARLSEADQTALRDIFERAIVLEMSGGQIQP